ncbi:AAA family ATPase [Salinibacterium hongtaonis]|uniref:Nuclease SbcCD subunit C n=1 Tax=Homoserinimonas hongtaonis TaxID=2079791 RepID=A0A2U1T0C8_9MICO|nr:SMC family ATPase [Salinibacterium hongtaonis]PWB97322.1 ATPase [Salinibacterium hongtaonis]
MRINTLVIAGFGPYKTPQRIDFDAFADDGIFLMAGKTGAGKSSILDAVCFALYNAVPRYEGTDKQLRSHHCDAGDPSYVTLEFTVGAERYRVHRSPDYERPAKRGGGMTTQKADAELAVWRDGDWHGIAARPVDVATELSGILGLTKDQFLQVILLAQNRFQQFLLAKNDERQALLQTLFGTQRFERYELAIVEQARSLEAQLGDAQEQRERDTERARGLLHGLAPLGGTTTTSEQAPSEHMPTGPSWFEHSLNIIDAHLVAVDGEVLAAFERASSAEEEHRIQVERRGLQRRRDDARAQLVALQAERENIANARRRLVSADHAAAVAPQSEALSRAERTATAAGSVEAQAREVWATLTAAGPAVGDGVGDGVESESLAAIIDESSRTLGALEDALDDESALPALDGEVRLHAAEVERLDAEIDRSAQRALLLPSLVEECSGHLTAALVDAARVSEAEARVERASAALAAASEAVSLGETLDAARRAELDASTANSLASSDLNDLLARRIGGFAGELAESLAPGEPCAVCGSTSHPAPAAPAEDAVTEADIDSARAALDRSVVALKAAEAAAREAGQLHAAALARADGKSVAELEGLLAEAVAAHASATAAVAESSLLAGRHATLTAELAELGSALQSLREQRDAADRSRSGLVERRAAIADRVARHRADYTSVAARSDALRATITAARTLLDAMTAHHNAVTARESAAQTLAEQLAQHGFESAEYAEGAAIAATERTALEQSIRAHERADDVARATLAEPELAGLPDEPIDATQAEASRDAARALLSEANSQRGIIAERHAQMHTLVSDVRSRSAETEALAAEYEQIAGLAAAVQGKGANTRRMRLETYVLAAQLEEIVAAANGRLRTMTAGRYELQHDDSVQFRKTQSGLGLAILDQHTGRARPTHSLSGGETFLASLALALGLAEVVTAQSGGITLDTLFVDEGFGSLDGDTLEIAMGTLDSLRAGGRTIGLISHVEAMKEQIPASLGIRVTDGGWSEIVQGAA